MAGKNGLNAVDVPVQSVKFVMREVGATGDMIDSQAFSDYLAYEYSEYRVLKASEYPIVNGANFLGFRLCVWLVKDNV